MPAEQEAVPGELTPFGWVRDCAETRVMCLTLCVPGLSTETRVMWVSIPGFSRMGLLGGSRQEELVEAERVDSYVTKSVGGVFDVVGFFGCWGAAAGSAGAVF